MIDDIDISDMRIIPTGELRAICSVRMCGLVIHGFKIVDLMDGEGPCILFPKLSWKDRKTREIHYESVIEMHDDRKRAVEEKIFQAYRRKRQEQAEGEEELRG